MESYDNVQTKQRWSFLPSRVDDVHGNSLAYGYTGLGANGRYFGASPDVRVSAPFLTSITSSDGRSVTLDYESAEGPARIAAISRNGTVLRRYRYNAAGELAEVEAVPSQAYWGYEYFPLAAYDILTP